MATALAYYEHAKKSQPSVILDLYLMISILCDFARLRTLATAGAFSNDPIFMAFFVLGFAARVLLLVADHIPSPEGKVRKYLCLRLLCPLFDLNILSRHNRKPPAFLAASSSFGRCHCF